MEVIVQPDAQRATGLAARIIGARVRANPSLVLGLATGRTMEHVYGELAKAHELDGLDFSDCSTFNLDEYIGLGADDPHAYRYYMNRHLFQKINVDIAKTQVLNGMADDLTAEAARFEAAILMAGGIDLQLLGLGESGHIGFNEPLSALMSRTRDKTLTPTTRRQNAELFGGDIERVPKRALTMGVGTILEAHELLLVVTGEAKADILARAVEGPITAMVSASAIQLHPNCKVIADEPAASYLEGRDYYDWTFENEPEWAAFRD